MENQYTESKTREYLIDAALFELKLIKVLCMFATDKGEIELENPFAISLSADDYKRARCNL